MRSAAQVAVLLKSFEAVEMEKDLVTSLACAFAWDFQMKEIERYGGEHSSSRIALEMWDEAVKAATE